MIALNKDSFPEIKSIFILLYQTSILQYAFKIQATHQNHIA